MAFTLRQEIVLVVIVWTTVQTLALSPVESKGSVKKDAPSDLMDLFPIKPSGERDILDPYATWTFFNKHDEIQQQKEKQRKPDKCHQCISIGGPPGPTGERGRRGPQGPPGGPVSLQDIQSYIQDYLKEVLPNTRISTSPPRKMRYRTPIQAAFSAQLPKAISIYPEATTQIKDFSVNFSPQQFRKGIAVENGNFYVTRSGVYQFAATLFFDIASARERSNAIPFNRYSDQVSIYTCIDQCDWDRRLMWRGSLAKGPSTEVLTAILRLYRGQKLYLQLVNRSNVHFEMGDGSTMSTAFLGSWS